MTLARAGTESARQSIEFLSPSMNPIAALDLFDLLPLSFPPYVTPENTRTITLEMGHFRFP